MRRLEILDAAALACARGCFVVSGGETLVNDDDEEDVREDATSAELNIIMVTTTANQ